MAQSNNNQTVRYKRVYVNNYISNNTVFNKKPFYVKYFSVILCCLAFFLVAVTVNSRGVNSLPNDNITYDLDWRDVGITLDEEIEDNLSYINVNYSNGYGEELVDSPIFDRFINMAKSISEFGSAEILNVTIFKGHSKVATVMNGLLSVIAIPINLILEVLDLFVSLIMDLCGFDAHHIEVVEGGSGGGGFFGGR